ncbi:HAD family hydrolase [Ovoidimarina sediminis]|uniref:HAD family hydrolase n=1 Tax=Ovoidimarina sediminis TaxID=3079856 RepID=UPI002907B1DA|nr:HAD family phosphatase [Rhodophyticola sp. MJ-SS7]MDU8944467.1 HAD family phosphatase [Rhodophyticola sp. MJ-SS7]
MIDAVIFDIGNVLIEWQPERYYDREFGEARRREVFEAVDLHGMNDGIDRGADFRDTVYRTAAAHPDYSDEIRRWHDDWLELAQPEISHSVHLLRQLRAKGIPVFALTNFGIGSFVVAEGAYPFLTEFDRRYISGHMQVIKPEPRIYEMVEDDCGIAPDRLIFTDDRADNIATAAARGWQTHLFEGPEGWAARLVDEGLLTRDEAGL